MRYEKARKAFDRSERKAAAAAGRLLEMKVVMAEAWESLDGMAGCGRDEFMGAVLSRFEKDADDAMAERVRLEREEASAALAYEEARTALDALEKVSRH